MATHVASKCGSLLLNFAVANTAKCSVGIGALMFTRDYKPYSLVPKAFRKPKDRNKKNRDDVYFLHDQIPPLHSLDDAVDVLRAYDLFGPEPIDLMLMVNMGEKKTRIGSLKGLVRLPKPVIPKQSVLVFAEGEDAEKAKLAGATIVGGVELIKQVENKELVFDHCLSTLDFLPNIKHLPKILRNKMPNTRRGTATDDIVAALETFSQGETYIADDRGRMRQTIALTNFSNEEIRSNVEELMKTVASHKTVTKEKFFKRVGLVIPPGPKLDLLVEDIMLATPNYAPMDLFTSLDKNNDKTLSREEIAHYVDYQVKMYRNKNAPKMTPEEHKKMIDEIMEKEDKNGDGVIQHSEFSGPKMPHGGEL